MSFIGPACEPLTVSGSNTTNHTGWQGDTVLVQCNTGFEVSPGVHHWQTNCAQNRTWVPMLSCSSLIKFVPLPYNATAQVCIADG